MAGPCIKGSVHKRERESERERGTDWGGIEERDEIVWEDKVSIKHKPLVAMGIGMATDRVEGGIMGRAEERERVKFLPILERKCV